jgi:DNA invertase Pin-like site-specific DNA recombinase
MIYGYARVSTVTQGRDGNGLDAQERDLRRAGAEVVYKDRFTGTGIDRPELGRLLGVVETGDTVVVTKLDRLARSVRAGVDVIEELLSRGVTVHVLNMGVMDNSASGRLLRTVMLAFAEFERDMIVERTTEGRELARLRDPDWVTGRPRRELPDWDRVYGMQVAGEITVEQGCRMLGIGRSTWYNRARESRD